MSNPDALYASGDAWEYTSFPADLTKDPEDATRTAGPVRWFEVMVTGAVNFTTATGRTCTWNIVAGRIYPIQLVKITSAPGAVRVGW